MTDAVHELAPAKLNLVLEVGRRQPSGLHEVCSLMASIDLADVIAVEPLAAPPGAGSAAHAAEDLVEAEGVTGPNLAAEALASFRVAAPGSGLPPLTVRIDKRIPVAAGLGGGSADAAAMLRVANRLTGEPLDHEALARIAASLGSDVPSQLEPTHALVAGTGERVERVALQGFAAVLVPGEDGLATAEVYAELDRRGGGRDRLDRERVRALAREPLDRLGTALENDLQPAAIALRPELGETLEALRGTGALGVLVSGSGPTVFGLFERREHAETAAARLPGAIVAESRSV